MTYIPFSALTEPLYVQTVVGSDFNNGTQKVSNFDGYFLEDQLNVPSPRHFFSNCNTIDNGSEATIDGLSGAVPRSSQMILGTFDDTEAGGNAVQWGLNWVDIVSNGTQWILKATTDFSSTTNITVPDNVTFIKVKTDTSWTTFLQVLVGNEYARIQCQIDGSGNLAFRSDIDSANANDYAWVYMNVAMSTRGTV